MDFSNVKWNWCLSGTGTDGTWILSLPTVILSASESVQFYWSFKGPCILEFFFHFCSLKLQLQKCLQVCGQKLLVKQVKWRSLSLERFKSFSLQRRIPSQCDLSGLVWGLCFWYSPFDCHKMAVNLHYSLDRATQILPMAHCSLVHTFHLWADILFHFLMSNCGFH